MASLIAPYVEPTSIPVLLQMPHVMRCACSAHIVVTAAAFAERESVISLRFVLLGQRQSQVTSCTFLVFLSALNPRSTHASVTGRKHPRSLTCQI